jgi:hypothetical protein
LAALESKESAARSRAGELREQIAGLSESLTLVETELSRLQITRETMAEVLADRPGGAGPVADAESAVGPLTELVPVLLAAEASGDATVTSEAYRQILVVLADGVVPAQSAGDSPESSAQRQWQGPQGSAAPRPAQRSATGCASNIPRPRGLRTAGPRSDRFTASSLIAVFPQALTLPFRGIAV